MSTPSPLATGYAHQDWSERLAGLSAAQLAAHASRVRVGAEQLGIWRNGGHIPLQPFAVESAALTGLHDIGSRLQDLLVSHALAACDGDLARLCDIAGLPADERWFLPAAVADVRALGCRRADVLVERGSPRFLELNFGTCLNGASATPVLSDALLRTDVGREMRERHDLSAPSLFAARLAWVRAHASESRPLALLGLASTGDEGSLRAFHEEADYFASQGVPCDFVPVEEAAVADSALVWGGKRYGAAIRYYMATPRSLAEHGDLFRALERAGETVLFGSYVSQLFTSKALLADLRCDPALTAAQRDLVEHVPWLARLRPGLVARGDEVVDPVEWAVGQQDHAVVKPANLYGSQGVVFGPSRTAGEWRGVVERAVTEGGYVVQELVVPDLWTAHYWKIDTEESTSVSAPVLLGPYVVDGRSGGCFAQQPLTGESTDLVTPSRGLSFGTVVSAG